MIKKIDQIKDLIIVPSVDEQPRLAINQIKILNLLIELRAEAEQYNITDVGNCALSENEKLVLNMCVSFESDFGLLPSPIQEGLVRNCKEWLKAYENNR